MGDTGERTWSGPGRGSAGLPHRVVDYGTGPVAFRTMREETALLSELAYDGPSDHFAARTSTFHLSSALLTEAHMPRVRGDRTPLLVARSGIDHYLVFMYRRGQCHQWIGSGELVITPGDVGVMDLTCPARTVIVPRDGERFARPLSMILPRTVLAPLLPGTSTLGQQRIHRDSFYGRALRELLLNLWQHRGERGRCPGRGDPGRRRRTPHAPRAGRCRSRARRSDAHDDPEPRRSHGYPAGPAPRLRAVPPVRRLARYPVSDVRTGRRSRALRARAPAAPCAGRAHLSCARSSPHRRHRPAARLRHRVELHPSIPSTIWSHPG